MQIKCLHILNASFSQKEKNLSFNYSREIQNSNVLIHFVAWGRPVYNLLMSIVCLLLEDHYCIFLLCQKYHPEYWVITHIKHAKGKVTRAISLAVTSCVILGIIKESNVINVIHNSEKSH